MRITTPLQCIAVRSRAFQWSLDLAPTPDDGERAAAAASLDALIDALGGASLGVTERDAVREVLLEDPITFDLLRPFAEGPISDRC